MQYRREACVEDERNGQRICGANAPFTLASRLCGSTGNEAILLVYWPRLTSWLLP